MAGFEVGGVGGSAGDGGCEEEDEGGGDEGEEFHFRRMIGGFLAEVCVCCLRLFGFWGFGQGGLLACLLGCVNGMEAILSGDGEGRGVYMPVEEDG